MALNLVCAVLDRGPRDLAEMAVLLAIADSADKDSGEAWPSQRTIAARSRQTDRSVRNVLNRLRDAGWLTWEPRKRANGSATSNVYTINLQMLGEAPRNDVPTPPEPPSGEGRNPVPGTGRNPVPAQNLIRMNKGAMSRATASRRSPPDGGGVPPSRVVDGRRQYLGPDGSWHRRPDGEADARAFDAWIRSGNPASGAQAQAVGHG